MSSSLAAGTEAVPKAAGRAPELHWFEDEGHGFRRQANQAGMLEWMFSFYRKYSQKANDHAENLS
jgi:dipeptidyl aminopeptidase/acylaminoacyl peptidase